jgi:hypothetical protein
MMNLINILKKKIHTGIWDAQLANWQQSLSAGVGISRQCPQQHQSGFGLSEDGWCPPGCGCTGSSSSNIRVGFEFTMPTANSRSFSSEAELTMFCNKHFTNLIKP